MTVEEWLGTDNQIGIDIWERKYRYENESFEEWLDRVSGNDENVKKLIREKKFLFGGRILANRGLSKYGKKVTLSNCYVIDSPEDNIESIFDCAKKLARTYSYGGGCGIDISKLSPAGSKINNASKKTSGATSFMKLYNLITELIGMEGRRGALIISLDCTHPDLLKFINIKNDLKEITKTNISIKISDDFMYAIEQDLDWKLTYIRKETSEKIEYIYKARDIFRIFAKMNWDYAEPGILFWDKIKNWSLLSDDRNFNFESVNPCGEEPLPAGGSCLLGSINLSEFIIKTKSELNILGFETTFDALNFKKVVDQGVIALNKVLYEGLPLHPLQEQRESVNNWRQIGLGIFGYHDMLIKIGLKYGSEDAIKLTEKIGQIMINQALLTSANLTNIYGKYPNYDSSAILSSNFFIKNINSDIKEIIEKNGLANSQLLTIPPTGTLGTMLGVSTGLEPIYDIFYTRKTESLHSKEELYKIYTPIIKEYMKENNIKFEKDLPDFINTATTIHYTNRIDTQAAWQKYVDASISSTINIPNNFIAEEVEDLYLYAWKQGLKGITIYRDGCKREGILTTSETIKNKDSEVVPDSIIPISRASLGKTHGSTSDKKSACGKMYITINRDKSGNIIESFVNVSNTGICKSNIDGINRLISLCLRSGVKVEKIINQLKGIVCQACIKIKPENKKIDGLSCPDIIGKTLEGEYNDKITIGRIETMIKSTILENPENKNNSKCPDCDKDLRFTGGCQTCTCGWSKCE